MKKLSTAIIQYTCLLTLSCIYTRFNMWPNLVDLGSTLFAESRKGVYMEEQVKEHIAVCCHHH